MKNKTFLRWAFLFVLMLLSGTVRGAKEAKYLLFSPNGKLKVGVNCHDQLSYQLFYQGNVILTPSNIGLNLYNGKVIGRKALGTTKRSVTEDIESPFYRFKHFTAKYNEMNLRLNDGFGIIFRAYDEGMAYRFYTTQKGETKIGSEIADFCFEKVNDEALLKACDILSLMLAKRADVKAQMVKSGCHVMIIGKDEETCDIPEFKHLCNSSDSIKYWNWRARGFGGAPEDAYSASCGEENVLALPGDRYVGENILIHEFSHLIQSMGIEPIDPTFAKRLDACYKNAKEKGLWDNTYALSNTAEYFAETVQSFFNCNQYSEPANGIHNWVNRRIKLKNYDPMVYDLIKDYFYEIDIPIHNKVHR